MSVAEAIKVCKNCNNTFSELAHKIRIIFCPNCREAGRNFLKAEARPCERCGKIFRPSRSKNSARFCSYTCSGYYINSAGLGPKYDDTVLMSTIKNIVLNSKHTLSKEELCRETGITHKTLKARGWKLADIYKDLGKPYSKPKLASYLEDRVYSVLISLFDSSEIQTQHTFSDMLGIKGGLLKCDFYIYKYKIIIEADGNQHRDSRGGLYDTDYIKANDALKDAYAKTNNIIMLRIPQTTSNKLIKNLIIKTITPLQAEKFVANLSNCWKGGIDLPISSEACAT